jgi:hypothetical protein
MKTLSALADRLTGYSEIRGFKYLSLEQRRALEQFVPEFMKKRISMTNASKSD